MYLETKSITKTYDGKTVIENINIGVEKGELVCLLGVSGSGKTTIFNILSGLERPDGDGRVFLKGEDITAVPGKISYMLQKDLLLPYYTVLDNVSLPLIIKKDMKKKEAREEAKKHFSVFGIESTEDKYPNALSGGMRQRAALLRTYLASEDIALLDEPFSALDTITKSAVHSWYLDIMEKIRLTTLFVTHDIDEAILLSDRIYILGGSPGTITKEIVISEPKPRSRDFTLTTEFLEYKKEIVRALGKI